MVTITALAKEFTLKTNSNNNLADAAKLLQSIIDELESSTPGLNRDQLLILAGLEIAQKVQSQTGSSSNSDDKVQVWTDKLEQICDKIDLSIKEAVKSA